jgi:N-acyl-D-aspartate/D-glutamate deacylase
MTDLIIRGGTVVDGTGAPPVRADVAIADGRIVEVGDVAGPPGARTIDADGALVTPGFVDIHTHFDGQATWDPVLAPSSLHGVTTIAMGNCGVGFAPAHADQHDFLIGLLEGVEDIPGTALAEGLTWEWESFPQYLDALERTPHTVDVGVHVPHAALRAYAMGERGADHTASAAPGEIDAMATMVDEAMAAGALGFATSRTEVHRTRDGANIGTLRAGAAELLALADVLRRHERGVVQLISDCYQTTDDEFADAEMDLIEEIARVSGRPVSFTVQQAYHAPDRFRHLFARVADANERSLALRTQVAARPIGVLLGLEVTANPFLACASYGEISALPLAERVVAMRDDERRRRIVTEHDALVRQLPEGLFRQISGAFDVMFRLSDPVDYELDPATSVAAEARSAGTAPAERAYDLLLEDGGRQLLYLPLFNFARHSFDDLAEMLRFRWSLLGLSDAGAHCGAICDASFTTTSIALWGRDRRGGDRFPVEWLVHANTQRNARHVGWHDRGVLAPGYLGDVNVIDLDALACHPPEVVHDLPAGGRRLVQRAAGYRATVKRGAITFVDGRHTGELPGRLLRGDQPAPR